ncbi:hypothetical protein OG689_11080 [Kitasatospora sp. NBC_00240]|uniref:hypothetical protein n=1 Tax=Kitasatospora sp. NBC_00240 TaxID=2903567 RepID=UPI00224CFDF7|nr:hypothetical protein [Kitasatospora sp. NBC_00240]MCX5209828.1 hypothetical protein [Kitasatospora sp. NBC_00240]
MPKIFGREPALLLALVAAVVNGLPGLGVDLTSGEQAALNTAAATVVAIAIAVIVHDGLGAAILGLIQALGSLVIGFGFHWNTEQQAAVMLIATAAVAVWTRTQVTAPVPAKAPLPPLTAVSGDAYGG